MEQSRGLVSNTASGETVVPTEDMFSSRRQPGFEGRLSKWVCRVTCIDAHLGGTERFAHLNTNLNPHCITVGLRPGQLGMKLF